MKLRALEDLEVRGRRILLRGDLNVPLDGDRIADDFRIRAILPTLRELLDAGATQVIVASHLGRPKGAPDPALSLAPAAAALADALGEDVSLVPSPVGPVATERRVAMLENLRFHPGEARNDPEFAKTLAALADVYVNDAFGSVHRAHASVAAVAERLPAAAGRLLEREVRVLTRILEAPDRPFVAVLGGAKVSDKLGVVDSLLRRCDRLLVGGGMCFTFLRAQGLEVGRSLVEEDHLEDVAAIMEAAGDRLLLPTDVVVAGAPRAESTTQTVPVAQIPAGQAGYDIGPASASAFAVAVGAARTILWNGPMGVAEVDEFAEGTRTVAEAVAAAEGFSVVGGGDSAAALRRLGLADRVDHLSTGGGATLAFLEGRDLPGLTPLRVS